MRMTIDMLQYSFEQPEVIPMGRNVYEFLLILQEKSTIHAGKYTLPMDPVGLKGSDEHLLLNFILIAVSIKIWRGS